MHKYIHHTHTHTRTHTHTHTCVCQVRRDAGQAEQLYKQALTQDPADSAALCNYAMLLTEHHHDLDAAQFMYQTALAHQPADAAALASYASFLQAVRCAPVVWMWVGRWVGG